MNDQAQGIGDQPVSEDEMADVDQSASMFGQIAEPAVDQPGDTVTPSQSDDGGAATPVIEPTAPAPVADDVQTQAPAATPPADQTDTPIADALVDQPTETPEGDQANGGLAQPETDPAPTEPADQPAPAGDDVVPQPWTGDVDEGSDEGKTTNDDTNPQISPVTPATDGGSESEEDKGDTPAISSTHSKPVVQPVSHSAAVASQLGNGDDDELLEVKQQALQELTPLVDTLNLPPEERFDTLMMIIRASDDKNLVKPAYEAANQISDQDKKARALLDVVNEVNYLTQHGPDSQKTET